VVDAGALTLDLKDNLDLAAVMVDGGSGRGVDAAGALEVVEKGVFMPDLKHLNSG